MDNALSKTDETALRKAQTKYKPRVKEIAELYRKYETNVSALKKDLQAEHLCLDHVDNPDRVSVSVSNRWSFNDREAVIGKIVVQLQYSKEPDFLKSIDSLVLKEVKTVETLEEMIQNPTDRT